MSKKYKILTVIFCIGVMICGLGIGIGFLEFSSFTYEGMQTVGRTDMKTRDIDVAFEPGDEPYRIWRQREWGQKEIKTDSSVPLNHVRFQVTYNAERVTPSAYLDEEEKEFHFMARWSGNDVYDMEAMMEAKDVILQNIKERKLVSVDVVNIEEIVILVNPENEKDVELIY